MNDETYLAKLDELLKEETNPPTNLFVRNMESIFNMVDKDLLQMAFACTTEMLFDNKDMLEEGTAIGERILGPPCSSERKEYKAMVDRMMTRIQEPDMIIPLDIKIGEPMKIRNVVPQERKHDENDNP